MTPFSLEELQRISGRMDCLFLVAEVPDSCPINGRIRNYLLLHLPRTCIYFWVGCSVHKVHRILAHSLSETSLVGDVHAIQLVSQSPRNQNAMMQGLRRVLKDSLVFIRAAPPPAQSLVWTRHLKSILSHTLARRHEHVRGRAGDADNLQPGKGAAAMQARCDKLVAFLNGDVRSSAFTHYCQGCCRNRDQCIDTLAAVLFAGLL